MASVTFSSAIGGDNSVVTDDNNASTGLGNGGHRTRFVPALAQIVAIATYITNVAAGVSNAYFTPVRVATTANITLSGTQTIDGVAVIANDRVLVKDQSTGSQNGIYLCASGAWTRTTDSDGNAEWVAGKAVAINEGTTQADTVWLVTNDGTITVGSTALAFARFPSLGKPNTWTALQTYSVAPAMATGTAGGAGIGTNMKVLETDQAIGSIASGGAVIVTNATYNSGWKKIASGFATAIGMSAGVTYFYVSSVGAGSAGDAITWTLTASISTAGVLKQGADGVVTQGKHSFFIPAKSFKTRTTNGALPSVEETTTNKIMYEGFDFDGTTQEFVCGLIRFPKHWNGGTITFAPVWRPLGGAGTEGVVWSLQGVAISDGDAYDAAYGTAVLVTDARQSSNTILHQGAESGAVTIAGTPAVGDLVALQFSRVPADAGDTLTAIDARFLGVMIFYTVDKANDA